MEEKVENFVEVVASITMSKNLCFPVTEGMTKEELLDLAKKEMQTPNQIIDIYKQALDNFGVKIKTEVDLNNWYVDELEYIVNGGDFETTEGEQPNA